MLLIEVLSNDEGSVIEDAKYSAGSDAAAALSRAAGSRGKTVPRPYTPPGGHKLEDIPGEDPSAPERSCESCCPSIMFCVACASHKADPLYISGSMGVHSMQ